MSIASETTMRSTWIVPLIFAGASVAFAEQGASEIQIAQNLLNEIRALRVDLQTTAATIQRVQIVMYRLQAQTAASERAKDKLDQAQAQCKQAQENHQQLTEAIKQAEARRSIAENAGDEKREQTAIAQLTSQIEWVAASAQKCQTEQTDAENQSRTEESKMSELQSQLDELDRALASQSKR